MGEGYRRDVPDSYRLRRAEPADAVPLTEMLHRAYAELGARGLNFTAVDQDWRTTLSRLAGGASWVLVDADERIAATVTMSLPPSRALRELSAEASVPDRAWLNQMAVDPAHRGHGLAARMRDEALAWARAQGASAVGVDTAEPAEHLVAMYAAWGFEPRETVQWPGKTYRSAVMVRSWPGPELPGA